MTPLPKSNGMLIEGSAGSRARALGNSTSRSSSAGQQHLFHNRGITRSNLASAMDEGQDGGSFPDSGMKFVKFSEDYPRSAASLLPIGSPYENASIQDGAMRKSLLNDEGRIPAYGNAGFSGNEFYFQPEQGDYQRKMAIDELDEKIDIIAGYYNSGGGIRAAMKNKIGLTNSEQHMLILKNRQAMVMNKELYEHLEKSRVEVAELKTQLQEKQLMLDNEKLHGRDKEALMQRMEFCHGEEVSTRKMEMERLLQDNQVLARAVRERESNLRPSAPLEPSKSATITE